MTFNPSNKSLEKAFEFLGVGVALTLVQMVVLYVLFAVELGGRFNVFLLYRAFFERFLFPLDRLYFLFADIMYRIFGGSYLHVPGFNNVFKLTFFTIFLLNLAFVAVTRRGRKDEAG